MRVRRRGWRTGLAVVLAVGGGVALPATAGAAAAPHQVRDDFNGDGYADLAVAAPDGTVAGRAKAGFVGVLYGSASGLKSSTKQVFSQNTAGVPGGSEAGDRFGSALTTADLDRDGYSDLIVGVGGEDGGAGRVQVVWGGARGLAGGATLASGAAGDRLGAQGHLAAADVDGDGATDLLTAVDRYGLVATGGPFTRSGAATGERQVVRDRYDSRVLDLDVGDLNGDGITDVVAAQTGTDTFDSRRVAYWWGTKDGLTPWTLVWDIDGAALQGGENLAVGDVNRDGYADIVGGPGRRRLRERPRRLPGQGRPGHLDTRHLGRSRRSGGAGRQPGQPRRARHRREGRPLRHRRAARGRRRGRLPRRGHRRARRGPGPRHRTELRQGRRRGRRAERPGRRADRGGLPPGGHAGQSGGPGGHREGRRLRRGRPCG
ncbi:hypothetical protein RKD20_005830 [Streptomyces sp. SLBN-8D4]